MSNKEFEFINQEENKNRMNYLKRYMVESEYYTGDTHFRVFNHEAASGKSISTFSNIAEIVVNTSNKIVYVQSFANDVVDSRDNKKILETVQRIENEIKKLDSNQSGKKVGHLTSENAKFHKDIINQSQVIVITHSKYKSICSGKSSNFIKDVDFLIIDEFPNLFNGNSFAVDKDTLISFKGFCIYSENEIEIQNITTYILDKLEYYSNKVSNNMVIVNLHKLDVKRYVSSIEDIIIEARKSRSAKSLEAALKIKELLLHTSVYHGGEFHSYYEDVIYVFAKKNNIVLDANAGFDNRYLLMKEMFVVDRQMKVFDYSKSKLIMHPISTTMSTLRNYSSYILDIFNYDRKTRKSKTGALIISDKKRADQLTIEQREEIEGNNVGLTHHGNFIGENTWGKMETVYLTKTPYYRFSDYVLMYLFYSREEMHGNTDCTFKNKKGDKFVSFKTNKFEKLKNSIMVGEYYQGAKRIGRTNKTESVEIHILTQHTKVFDLLSRQFKNIEIEILEESDIVLTEKNKVVRKKRESPKKDEQVGKVIQMMEKAQMNGESTIQKVDICDKCGIRRNKLSSILKEPTIIDYIEDRSIEIARKELKLAI